MGESIVFLAQLIEKLIYIFPKFLKKNAQTQFELKWTGNGFVACFFILKSCKNDKNTVSFSQSLYEKSISSLNFSRNEFEMGYVDPSFERENFENWQKNENFQIPTLKWKI